LRLPDDRATRSDRPAYWCGADLRRPLLGVRRLVALADDLFEQGATPRKEAARGDRLDSRSLVCEGLRAVPHDPRRCDVVLRKRPFRAGAATESCGGRGNAMITGVERTASTAP